MAICGDDEEDAAGAPPMALGGGQGWFMGGHYAFIAITAALCQRDETGVGQYLDVSVHDSCVLTTEGHINRYVSRNDISERNRRGPQHRQEPVPLQGRHLPELPVEHEMTPEHLAFWPTGWTTTTWPAT